MGYPRIPSAELWQGWPIFEARGSCLPLEAHLPLLPTPGFAPLPVLPGLHRHSALAAVAMLYW